MYIILSVGLEPPNVVGFAQADGATYCYAADLNGDDSVDVLFTSLYGNVSYFENDGTGGFDARVDLEAAGLNPMSVVAGDIDDDGDMDVVAALNGEDGYIVWYENDGSGNFAAGETIAIESGVSEAILADLDGDGDLDILSVSFDDSRLAWFENLLYEPSTAAPAESPTMTSPSPVVGVDGALATGTPVDDDAAVSASPSPSSGTNRSVIAPRNCSVNVFFSRYPKVAMAFEGEFP